MKSADEIREEFLRFFEEKHQCTRVKSSSLVPDNPTILLTTAGMVQFVPYFLGLKKPPYDPPRAVSCQKCARAGGKDSDIENVGRTPRHHTFFEMLGNFSFGDYFKEEIIPWAWDFVLNYLKLEKERLWITIYEDDDESAAIWEKTGVSPDRILRKGKKDNFWGPPGPTGPCGPCSEIHYDLGEHLKCSDDCSIATCECDRWMEIWNLVFMELFQDETGRLTPLAKKNVDTGMGLERVAMVCQGVNSTFETDLLRPILDKICTMAHKKYLEDKKTDVSLRIITDHTRCVTFMVNDLITPSNEGRGYVLRMILRRALRHGFILGLEIPFMKDIVETVIENYKISYPELAKDKKRILDVIQQEEERFKLTLDKGYRHIEDVIKNCCGKTIKGADAFKLYDTYGFPLELTREIAHDEGFEVDVKSFNACMQEQKERARASVQRVILTNDLAYSTKSDTSFCGYNKDTCTAQVLAVIKDLQEVESSNSYDVADIILDNTVFYGECGGQTGDIGYLEIDGRKIEVLKTFRVGKVFVHRVQGAVKKGDKAVCFIDTHIRAEIEKHHSLAHLLQAALRQVLGSDVHQAGSQVDDKRTRYDFSYPRALKTEEIERVENQINAWIADGLDCVIENMSIDEAKSQGAIALFDEKYEKDVRVISFFKGASNVSKELCGGCHIKNTKDLRLCKIVSETAISAGTRRIEALCSEAAFNYLNEKSKLVDEISHKYKITPPQIEEKIEKLTAENKELMNKIGDMEARSAKEAFSTFLSKAKDVKIKGAGGKLLITQIENFAPNAVKFGLEMLSVKLGSSIIVLCSKKPDNTVLVSAKVTEDFVKAGISAGEIVGKITKALLGAGGGKPQMAQGVGKTSKGLNEILKSLEDEILNA